MTMCMGQQRDIFFCLSEVLKMLLRQHFSRDEFPQNAHFDVENRRAVLFTKAS